jgi:hypothetical protein
LVHSKSAKKPKLFGTYGAMILRKVLWSCVKEKRRREKCNKNRNIMNAEFDNENERKKHCKKLLTERLIVVFKVRIIKRKFRIRLNKSRIKTKKTCFSE